MTQPSESQPSPLHQRVQQAQAPDTAPDPSTAPSPVPDAAAAPVAVTPALGRRADEEFVFVPAAKRQAKLRLALAGPSGSGKTWTALQIATGLVVPELGHVGPSIGMIDTERESASKYADLFSFAHLRTPMTEFDPRKLTGALAAAAAARLQVAIIDTWSHFWSGSGGMLEQVDAIARRDYGGASMGGWKDMAPVERQMLDAMLGFPGHLIVTLRTKTDYVIEENERGKKVPRKVGTRPIQRDGMEYEFDVVGDLDLANTLTISKSRCPELSGKVIPKPGMDVSQILADWLAEGEPARSSADLRAAAHQAKTRQELRDLYSEAVRLGIAGAAVFDDHGQAVKLADYIGQCAARLPADRPGQQVPPATAPPGQDEPVPATP